MSGFRAMACACTSALALPLPTYMTTDNLSVLATEIIQRDNAAKGSAKGWAWKISNTQQVSQSFLEKNDPWGIEAGRWR